MFYKIDENTLDIIADKPKIKLVPAFRAVIEHPNMGWPFFDYIFLFCSYSPFGNLPEEQRDLVISEMLNGKMEGITSKQRKKTTGFYKTDEFKAAAGEFYRLFSNTAWDMWAGYKKDIERFNELKSKLDPTKLDDLELYDIYIGYLAKLSKLFAEAEKNLEINIRKNQQVGMGLMELDD